MRISDRSRIAANRGLEGTVVFTWRSVTMRQWCSVEIVPNGELSVPAHELDLLPTA